MAKGWNAYEDKILIEYYPSEGADVFKRLPGRSKAACQHRAQRLTVGKKNHWTNEEDEILIKYYPSEGRDIITRLPNKNIESCYKRASALGIKSQKNSEKWSKREEEYLIKNYEKKGAVGVAAHLKKRTVEACRSKAVSLGIQVNKTYNIWTQEEIEILLANYSEEGSEVSKRLPGKSRNACTEKANKLGLRYNPEASTYFDLKSSVINYINKNLCVHQNGPGDYRINVSIGKTVCELFLLENSEEDIIFTDLGYVSKKTSASDEIIHNFAQSYGIEYQDKKLCIEFNIKEAGEQLMNMILCISSIMHLYPISK